ncbi:MAG TPA: hypothetical protein H9707_04855, partial [Candidatus Butyricicoccus avicola]|nr:hypothetical protein [Candidatus Butyricicoccus avicola]
MKTSYTKRALAFWLAVAMVATGAPAALAREPDTGTGGSTSVSGTTTPTTPAETTEPGASQVTALTISTVTIKEKIYDGTTDIKPEDITVNFSGYETSAEPVKGTDYTVTGQYTNADASESAQATVTVELTEQGKQKYSLKDSTCSTTGKITKADVNAITPAKQSVQLNTG